MNIVRTVELGPNERMTVVADKVALCEATAELIAKSAQEAIAARGRFTIALSGGSTPKQLYELLATEPWRDRLDWSKVHLFWGDERYVPPTDAQSNFRMTSEALISKISIPAKNIHRIPTQPYSPQSGANKYEDTLRALLGEHPQIDFNLLGVGTNGHTASLFPHRPTLEIRNRLVVADFIPEVNMDRITMTLPVINDSRLIVFLVSGADKAQVVHDVLRGPRQPEQLPSQLVHPAGGELIWLVDEAAAELVR
ncbi:6-phosphogluconolactonase [Candidatus Koribacter versatilis Ellin345]|uniref:6-phosphogluconolactonase n=1 Tax=Koribacter versatilis (strain Ellin345) TaxID=204669 RepID=Q1IMT5_KORVE|nr:6-phosphogluconolactonase [Candidatus Koribacter versatilis]ABF41815.1 6-phosphogluconolactonase [Candidatus Koribacter versatilis Ellin345]